MKKAFISFSFLLVQSVMVQQASAQTPAPAASINLAPGAVQNIGNVQVACQRPSNSLNVTGLSAEQIVNLASGSALGICKAGYASPSKAYITVNEKYYYSQGSIELDVNYAGETLRGLVQAGACF